MSGSFREYRITERPEGWTVESRECRAYTWGGSYPTSSWALEREADHVAGTVQTHWTREGAESFMTRLQERDQIRDISENVVLKLRRSRPDWSDDDLCRLAYEASLMLVKGSEGTLQ